MHYSPVSTYMRNLVLRISKQQAAAVISFRTSTKHSIVLLSFVNFHYFSCRFVGCMKLHFDKKQEEIIDIAKI